MKQFILMMRGSKQTCFPSSQDTYQHFFTRLGVEPQRRLAWARNSYLDLHMSTRSSKGSLAKQVKTLGATCSLGNFDACLSKLVAGLPTTSIDGNGDIATFGIDSVVPVGVI